MRFTPHVLRLLTVPRIRATVRFAAAPVVDTDRARLAERLRSALEREFVPIPSPEEA
jgi:hypothetical protein